MSDSLDTLEADRSKLLQTFLTLGDLRPGSVTAVVRRCGRPNCHCAKSDDPGHDPQFRLTRRVAGKTITETFATGAPYGNRTLHLERRGGAVTEAFTRRPNPQATPAGGPHSAKLHRLPVAAQIKEEPDIQPWDRKTRLQRMCGQENVSIVRRRGRHG